VDRHFPAGQEILDDHLPPRIAENPLVHDLPQGQLGLRRRLRDNDALSGSEAVGFQHLRVGRLLRQIGARRIRVGKAGARRRRQAVLKQKLLGEDFAAFEPRRCRVRTKDRQACLLEAIDHSRAKWRFGSDDGQVRLFARGPCHETVEVGRAERKIRAKLGGPGIARRGEKLQAGIVLPQTPRHRVLASARTQEKNLHGDLRT
jgi:hypothetical protein